MSGESTCDRTKAAAAARRREALAAALATQPGGDVGDGGGNEARLARAVLATALAETEAEARRAGHGAVFAALRPWLEHDPGPAPLAQAAQQLGLAEGRLMAALRRLRRRFRQCVDATLATCATTTEARRALRHRLHAALSGEEPR